jgi:hypothetical protein
MIKERGLRHYTEMTMKTIRETNVIGQYGLYLTTTGNKLISPIATSISTTEIFDFVILSDIQYSPPVAYYY